MGNDYTEKEFDKIISNYNIIFNGIRKSYEEYIESISNRKFDNVEDLIICDYKSIDYEKLKIINDELREIRDGIRNSITFKKDITEEKTNEKLLKDMDILFNDLKKKKLGLSLGLNKYLDHFFSKSEYETEKKEFIISIGHDWYPLIPDSMPNKNNKQYNFYPFELPLEKYSPNVVGYDQYFEYINSDRYESIFFNLVPGFRKRFTKKSGSNYFQKDQYEFYSNNLAKLISALAKTIKISRIVLWGNNVQKYFTKALNDNSVNGKIIDVPHPANFKEGDFEKILRYIDLVKGR